MKGKSQQHMIPQADGSPEHAGFQFQASRQQIPLDCTPSSDLAGFGGCSIIVSLCFLDIFIINFVL